MKLKILSGIFAFLLCVMSVFAVMTQPYPIGGHVYLGDSRSDGIEISIKDMNTGEEVKVITDGSGYYLFDAGNFKSSPFPLSYGHTIRITACSENPECVKEIKIGDNGGQNVDFHVQSSSEVIWNGIKIGAGVLIAVLVLIGGGIALSKRRKISDDFIREILQNAQNVALGKLKGIQVGHNKLEKEDIAFALDYEKNHGNRKRIINYLNSL